MGRAARPVVALFDPQARVRCEAAARRGFRDGSWTCTRSLHERPRFPNTLTSNLPERSANGVIVVQQMGQIRCQEPISGTLVEKSRFRTETGTQLVLTAATDPWYSLTHARRSAKSTRRAGVACAEPIGRQDAPVRQGRRLRGVPAGHDRGAPAAPDLHPVLLRLVQPLALRRLAGRRRPGDGLLPLAGTHMRWVGGSRTGPSGTVVCIRDGSRASRCRATNIC